MPLIERLEQTVQGTLRAMTGGPVASGVEPLAGCHGLFAEEAALVAHAVPRRRSEFSAGRRAAHRALASLGCRPVPLLRGRMNEPLWPTGFAGSISHDGRFAAALAYPSASGRARLSIDLIDRPDPAAYRSVLGSILHPCDPRPADDDATAAIHLFSAKEAAVKIVSLHIGDLIDFRSLAAAATHEGHEVVAADAGLVVSVRTFTVDDVTVSLGMTTGT